MKTAGTGMCVSACVCECVHAGMHVSVCTGTCLHPHRMA